MDKINSALKKFYSELDQVYLLDSAAALGIWDMRVSMPAQGAEDRSKVLEYLSGITHQKSTSASFCRVVEYLMGQQANLSADDAINVKDTFRRLERERKISKKLAARLSRLSSDLYLAWVQAKAENNFSRLTKLFEKLVAATIERCQCIGFSEHPYQVLLDDYEPQVDWKLIVETLRATKETVQTRVREIHARQSLEAQARVFELSETEQFQLCLAVGKDLGFQADRFVLAISPHPFSIGIGRGDSRITVRYSDDKTFKSLLTMLHEMGHALYGSGLPSEHRGRPRGQDISTGIHESQSRFWENIVGRSRAFSNYLEQKLRVLFPEKSGLPTADELWREANTIKPSLIRVEADELSYMLHILVRMELELELFGGKLRIKDLPEAWNARYKEYLGVSPESDREGVLQDVHWYQGGYGYFPTYALGNLYNTAFTETMVKDIGSLDTYIETGNFKPMLDWLSQQVFQYGRTYNAIELIQKITGHGLTVEPFFDYIQGKFQKP